jgi:hypothetical protein
VDAATQYALAYALTTTAGVRALLALTAVAVATHFALIHPPQGFAWLGSVAVMWTLGALAIVEMLADKVPLLDHALHFLQIALKPAAAAIIVGGAVHAPSHAALIGLMVLGGLNALGVHAGIATLRGASTIATGGVANPAVSVAEDAGSIGALFLTFIAPLVGAILAVVFTIGLAIMIRTAYRKLRSAT